MIFPDGTTYVGEYDEGKREGKGKRYWLNGDVYEGEWSNDLFEG